MPPNVTWPHILDVIILLWNMHQVMEYHEHSYLVSLLFAAPFLLFIIFSIFFSTCSFYFFNAIILVKFHDHQLLKLRRADFILYKHKSAPSQ